MTTKYDNQNSDYSMKSSWYEAAKGVAEGATDEVGAFVFGFDNGVQSEGRDIKLMVEDGDVVVVVEVIEGKVPAFQERGEA